MQYEAEIGGQVRRVIVNRVGDGFAVAVDDRSWLVDAARVDAGTLSLIISAVSPDGGTPPRASYEAVMTPDTGVGRLVVSIGGTPVSVTLNGRRRRRDGVGRTGNGPHRLAAPMAGKVVRVLVHAGELVRVRQPLLVVEAMKMENELRADRDGTVAEIHVKEGASVDAGALLLEIR